MHANVALTVVVRLIIRYG